MQHIEKGDFVVMGFLRYENEMKYSKINKENNNTHIPSLIISDELRSPFKAANKH